MFVSAACGDGCPPCDQPCEPIVRCGGVTVPSLWKLTIAGIADCVWGEPDGLNGSYNGPAYTDGDGNAADPNGTFWIATENRAQFIGGGVGAWAPYEDGCSGDSIKIEYPIDSTIDNPGTLVPGRVYFPLKFDFAGTPFPVTCAFGIDPPCTNISDFPVCHVEYEPNGVTPTSTDVTLKVLIGVAYTWDIVNGEYIGNPLFATYTATVATLELVTYGSIVLSLSSNETDCTVPTELTLEVAGDPVANLVANCDQTCTELIGDGDHGILKHSGTIGGESVVLCLSDEGFDETLLSNVWRGTGDYDLTCGNKEIQIRVYCGKVDEEDTERVWLAEYENLTDGGVFKTALTITENDPLASTVSDTLTNFCGGAVTVASIDAAAGPLPNFPCCGLTDAELACLGTVPGLTVDETFNISDGDGGTATLTVTGTLPWDDTNGQWGPGDITWSQTGCAFGPIPDTVWEDCTITCDSSGNFSLNVPAPFSLTYNTTGDCSLPLSLSFTGVTSVVLCDASTQNVTLDFESV